MAALAFAFTGSAGAGGTAKYKLQLGELVIQCPGGCTLDTLKKHADGFVVAANGRDCEPWAVVFQGSSPKHCFGGYPPGTKVVLTPLLPDPRIVFDGWGGDCTGQPADKCVLVMDSNKSVDLSWTIN
jgi:hypothetical protein